MQLPEAAEFYELYVSGNGDRWSLGRDAETNRSFVLHEGNLASGGTHTEYSVKEFLARDHGSPQHEALVRLLAAILKSVD